MVELDQIISCSFDEERLLSATASSPRNKQEAIFKISVRPILVKGALQYQMSEHTRQKVFHKNLSIEACRELFKEIVLQYKQTLLCTIDQDYQLLIGKKGNLTIIKKPPTKSQAIPMHNRPKRHLLKEGEAIPFLVALGIMNSQGKVFAAKRDKFKQINRFLEIVADILPAFKDHEKLRVFDFGCGKAYLTFALYHYLNDILNYKVEIIGLDLKEEMISYCQSLAGQLNYTHLHFVLGNIEAYQPSGKIDLMVALHACDTATDAALEKAVLWKADAILSVPCCQHELLSQISNPILKPILQHGILKERFSALTTDAARGKLLEILGYSVQIMEFIDAEHTAKNILIRAVRQSGKAINKQAIEEYRLFKEFLHIQPAFERKHYHE